MKQDPGNRFKGQGFLRRQLETPHSQVLCARTAALLFLSSASLMITQQFLPWGSPMGQTWFVVIQGLTIIGALIAWFVYPRVTLRWFKMIEQPVMFLAWTLLWANVYGTGGADSPFSMLFMFGMLYAAYFWRPAIAVPHLILGSLLFVSPLAYDHANSIASGFVPFAVIMLGSTWCTLLVVGYRRAEMNRAEGMARVLALTDPLTGVANLRAVDEMQRLIGTQPKLAKAFALVMVDLDGLKKANSLYGHAGGDSLIKRLAALLTAASRPMDQVSRVGGDEFFVVLAGADEDGAEEWRQRFVALVREENSHVIAGEPQIAASVGIAVCPRDGKDLSQLKAIADRRMYEQKLDGRLTELAPGSLIGTPGNHKLGVAWDDSRNEHREFGIEIVAGYIWLVAALMIALTIPLPGVNSTTAIGSMITATLCMLMAGWTVIWLRLQPRFGQLINHVAIVVAVSAGVTLTGGADTFLQPIVFLPIVYFSYFKQIRRPNVWITAMLAVSGAVFFIGGSPPDRVQMLLITLVFGSAVLSFVLQNNGSKLVRAREHVEELAMTDALTQVGNRRNFETTFAHTLDDAEATGSPNRPFVLLVDLDDFKNVNTIYGHPGGDRLLRATARCLREEVGGDGWVYRIGGDEFAVLAETRAGLSPGSLAERCRLAIERLPQMLGHESQSYKSVSASFGYAAWSPGMDLRQLVRKADDALNQSKLAGKNTVSAGNTAALLSAG